MHFTEDKIVQQKFKKTQAFLYPALGIFIIRLKLPKKPPGRREEVKY